MASNAAEVNVRQDEQIQTLTNTQVKIDTTLGIFVDEQKEIKADLKNILKELRKQNGDHPGDPQR